MAGNQGCGRGRGESAALKAGWSELLAGEAPHQRPPFSSTHQHANLPHLQESLLVHRQFQLLRFAFTCIFFISAGKNLYHLEESACLFMPSYLACVFSILS